MNAKNIVPGDATLNIVIMAALDLIAGVLSFPILQYCRRKDSISMCFLITGATFVCVYYSSDQITKQIFAQIGQFVNTISFTLMLYFTADIYPTVVRGMAIGLLNGSSKLASVFPPLLIPFISNVGFFFSLGMMALLASGMIWLLPETKNMEMMDTLEEGENFNAKFGGLKYFRKK